MKRWLSALLVVLVLFTLSACSNPLKTNGDAEDAASQLMGALSDAVSDALGGDTQSDETKSVAAKTYHNGLLGVTCAIPSKVVVADLVEANMTENAADSMDRDALEWYEYGDGGSMLDLVTLQTAKETNDGDHAEFHVFAEDYPDFTYEEYLEATEEYLTEESDGYVYTLKSKGTEQLMGVTFNTFVLSVSHADNDVPYIEEYRIADIDGLYLNVYINYWSDSSKSKTDAQNMLKDVFAISR